MITLTKGEKISIAVTGTNNGSYRHGLAKTTFYRKYSGAVDRCIRTGHAGYKYYGGKGVKVEWDSFIEFRDDMYDSFKKHVEKHGEKNTSLDRIDVNGNYSKENCRWATIKEQNLNKTNTALVNFNGKTYSLRILSEKYNIKNNVLWNRVFRYKWSINKSLNLKP